MLEELIENQLLLPLIAVAALVLALICFRLGWAIKAYGANRREVSLHKDVRDAKASVPLLESTIRSREQLVARLQDELQAQKERSVQSQTRLSERERQLKNAQTEVRHLTHELHAIKGKSVDSRDFDLETPASETGLSSGESSVIADRLRVTEQLYDRLKTALIERSQRIEELERLVRDTESGNSDGDPSVLSSAEVDALQRQLDQRNRSITGLNAQIAQLKQEKEMVEALAQKRSQSNRSLKDSKSDVEAKKFELEQAVAEHQKTIADRELSIHRLLSEAQVVRKNLRDNVEESHRLKRANLTADEALSEALAKQQMLEQTISRHEARLHLQQEELKKALSAIARLERELADIRRESQAELATKLQAEPAIDVQMPVLNDLATTLEAQHRAHQASESAIRRVPDQEGELAPANAPDMQPVGGVRSDS